MLGHLAGWEFHPPRSVLCSFVFNADPFWSIQASCAVELPHILNLSNCLTTKLRLNIFGKKLNVASLVIPASWKAETERSQSGAWPGQLPNSEILSQKGAGGLGSSSVPTTGKQIGFGKSTLSVRLWTPDLTPVGGVYTELPCCWTPRVLSWWRQWPPELTGISPCFVINRWSEQWCSKYPDALRLFAISVLSIFHPVMMVFAQINCYGGKWWFFYFCHFFCFSSGILL